MSINYLLSPLLCTYTAVHPVCASAVSEQKQSRNDTVRQLAFNKTLLMS